MPNWCGNHLVVTGSHDAADFLENAEEVGLLKKIDPMPWSLLETVEGVGGGYAAWLAWAHAHWGCKWDPSSLDVDRHDDTEISLGFDTPWSPPVPAMLQLASRYPDAELRLEFVEEGNDFAGVLICTTVDGAPRDVLYEWSPGERAAQQLQDYCEAQGRDVDDLTDEDVEDLHEDGVLGSSPPGLLDESGETETDGSVRDARARGEDRAARVVERWRASNDVDELVGAAVEMVTQILPVTANPQGLIGLDVLRRRHRGAPRLVAEVAWICPDPDTLRATVEREHVRRLLTSDRVDEVADTMRAAARDVTRTSMVRGGPGYSDYIDSVIALSHPG